MVTWLLVGAGTLALASVVGMVIANARQVIKSQELLPAHPVAGGKLDDTTRASGEDD